MPVPTRLPVRVDQQVYAYELCDYLGEVPHGSRYRVVDITSSLPPEPGATGPVELHAALFQPTDAGHAERVVDSVSRFLHLNHPSLLAFYTMGVVEDGPPAGQAVLITEAWTETLAEVLARDGTLTDNDLLALFDAVSGGLFALHELGFAHGDLSPITVVRSASGWKLTPGHPARGATEDRPADIVAAGNLFRLALGWKEPSRTAVPPPLPSAKIASPSQSGVSGVLNRMWEWFDSHPRHRRPLRDVIAGPKPAPKPPPLPADYPFPSRLPAAPPIPGVWRTIIDGCTDPNPARRWKVERLVFGATQPPVIDEIRAEATSTNTFQLSWVPPDRGRVELLDLGNREPTPSGTIAGIAALHSLGAPIPLPGGTGVTVPLPGESRRIQAVTVLDERRLVVFGQWVRLSRIPDMRGLRVRASRNRLHLTWEWPAEIHIAYVLLRGDRYPSSGDDGQRVECLRTIYEANGRFDLPVPSLEGTGVFVTVFAAIRGPEGPQYSPGARYRLTGQPLHIRYSVQRTATGYELLLTPSRVCEFPPLVLVAGNPNLPLHASDGTVVATVPAETKGRPDQATVIPFKPEVFGQCKAKLFATRREDYDWLELTSDPVDGINLG